MIIMKEFKYSVMGYTNPCNDPQRPPTGPNDPQRAPMISNDPN